MRLAALKPPLEPLLLQSLSEIDVATSEDLLLPSTNVPLNLHLRSIFTHLPPNTIQFSDLLELANRVSASSSAPGMSGMELLGQVRVKKAQHPADEFISGVDKLDNIAGEFAGGRVLEISGTPSTGKTALAMYIVLRHLVRFEKASVLWIDTTNDAHFGRKLAAARLAAIESITSSETGEASGAETALDRFQIAKAYDAKGSMNALDAATRVLGAQEAAYQARPDSLVPRTRMIVVDSVTDLFAPELKSKFGHGHSLMTEFMSRLRSLSRAYILSILVLNGSARIAPPGQPPIRHPLSQFPGNSRPALGATFTFLTDGTLWISKFSGELGRTRSTSNAEIDERDVRIVEMLRGRYVASRTWCAICIRRDGRIESLRSAEGED